MDRLNQIQLMRKVAQHQSFSEAARSLGISNAAASKHIQALELQLGITLFTRTTRSVQLTEQGQHYLNQATQIYDELVDLESALREQDQNQNLCGSLKLSIPLSYGQKYLVNPLADFSAQHPDLKLDIELSDQHVNLIEENYDLVIRISHLEDSSLRARKLDDAPLILCASPDYLAQKGTPQTVNDLKHHACIAYTTHDRIRLWQLTNGQVVENIKISPTLEANNAEMMKAATLKGLGITLLPYFAVSEELQKGRLQRALPEYQGFPKMGIYALYPNRKFIPKKVKALIEFIASSLRETAFNRDKE